MKADDVQRWLRARAESYGRDASTLRADGDRVHAVVYEAIRDELRKCADEVESEVAPS